VASAAAAACVLAVGFALFCFNVIGAGDVKLAALTVLWCGADQTLPFLMNTALAGGLVVICLFLARRLVANLGMTRLSTLHSLRPGRSDIPYGVALALGGFAVLPATAWMP
jgi:prepilin peptidase CpaA